MTAIPISRQLMPPKQRLKELNEQLAQLRLQAKVAAGVTVLRIRSCEHEECGGRAPAELPDNCLVIKLGCLHQIPQVAPPVASESRSRLERPSLDDALGQGISPERQRKAIRSIRLL